jgi:signal transduction histidine kinase
MRFQRHQSALVLASALTVGSFVGATAYTQHRLTSLDALSSAIETDAAPSLEFIGRAGARLEHTRMLLRDLLEAENPSPETVNAARDELGALQRDIDSYLQLTPLPGEHELWSATRRNLDDAIAAARAVIDATQQRHAFSRASPSWVRADAALDRASRTVRETLEFDVTSSERLAHEMQTVRAATTKQIIVLDIFATAVATLSAFVAIRFSRRHDDLSQRHNALLNERISDLDRFAGRVAHDILSPLDAVGLGIALAGRSVDADGHAHLERAQRSLQRVKQLVGGLLGFARAGATSDANARCRVDLVLASVVGDCSEVAKEKGITVVLEHCERIEVHCAVGVLTSVVQNLVTNAIKYMGDAPQRQVVVRAHTAAARVQIEVADTGPGIPSELQATMFEPFVRGDHADVHGMGLGLATVKRLVEAHGGTVQVQSGRGTGTVFRVDLPIAGSTVVDSSQSFRAIVS